MASLLFYAVFIFPFSVNGTPTFIFISCIFLLEITLCYIKELHKCITQMQLYDTRPLWVIMWLHDKMSWVDTESFYTVVCYLGVIIWPLCICVIIWHSDVNTEYLEYFKCIWLTFMYNYMPHTFNYFYDHLLLIIICFILTQIQSN